MIDFLTIFTKGGIVLWCFDATSNFKSTLNQFILNGILQGKASNFKWKTDTMKVQFAMDNEFRLLFVVAYQNIVQLSYVDKLLSETQLRFRDKYKNELLQDNYGTPFDFDNEFREIYTTCQRIALQADKPRQPRKWEETNKAKKTVASMIQKKEAVEEKPKKTITENKKAPCHLEQNGNLPSLPPKVGPRFRRPNASSPAKVPANKGKRTKKATVWNESVDVDSLDYSQKQAPNGMAANGERENGLSFLSEEKIFGSAIGDLKDIDDNVTRDEASDFSPDEKSTKSKSSFGFLSGISSILAGKPLDTENLKPALAKMHEHLMSRNVAAEVSEQLCQHVEQNLLGKTLGTFQSVGSCVQAAMTEAVMNILTPSCPVNILREVLAAKEKGRPYVIVFCGVNGVGKSTNLAKIAFWLIENDLTVMIAACDTFRSGAVEQLQTHVRHLNSIHPPQKHANKEMVTLFQKGYGGDAASVCFSALNQARATKKDAVLVDTAGRMQDNEPLMRALTKLIHLNQPDLVLFVGEALVGNEAVDQARKFNQALSDFTPANQKPRLIDGMVLTKFDTVDDKVGAAVSMCYSTAKPIVFVGTGQTYSDLRKLNANAVVKALLK